MASSSVVRVAFLADTKQLERGMDRTTKATEGVSKKMSNMAKVAAAALAMKAVGAVTSFVNDSIESYSDLNESLNAVNVTFGKNADGIKKLGEEAATSLGLSNAEFNSHAVSLSAFVEKIAGDTGDVVGTMDTLTTRVSDFASVMNLEVDDALGKFRSGLAGESEPLRQFGIDVSAAKVESVALAEGIHDGNGEMTEGQKIQARYLAIMEQTEKTAGDFANTQDDLANKTRIANAELENQKARVGEALAPWKEVEQDIKMAGAAALGFFATGWQNVTGELSDAEAALQKFNITTGIATDSAEALVTTSERYGVSLEDLMDVQELETAELEKMRDSLDFVQEYLGLTDDETAQLAKRIDKELTSALVKDAEAFHKQEAAARAAAEGTDEHEDAVDEDTDAIEENISALTELTNKHRESLDPLFALSEATRRYDEAQLGANEARDEYGEGSPEHQAALEDEMEAWLDMQAAAGEMPDSLNDIETAFKDAQRQMGKTDDEIQRAWDKYLEFLGDFESADGSVSQWQVQVSAPHIKWRDTGSGMAPHLEGREIFHTGGKVRGKRRGDEVPAILKDGEEVLTEAQSKQRESHSGAPVVNINVAPGLYTQADVGRFIVEALQQYARTAGPLPADVRIN